MASKLPAGVPDWHSMTIAEILALPPEVKQQILLAMAEEKRRKNEEQQKQADELAKGPTPAQTAVGAIGPPAALAGGLYLANHGLPSLGGAAGAGAPATTAAATQGAATAGTAGASGAATGGAAAGQGAGAALGGSSAISGTGGAVAIPAGQAVPAGYTAVGTAADGGTLVAPASQGAGFSAGQAAAYAWPALAAYAVYDSYNKIKGAQKQAGGGRLTDQEIYDATHPDAINKITPDWLSKLDQKFNPGSWLLQSFLGSSKHPEQLGRDRVRKRMKDAGFFGDGYQISTPGGGNFDIGLEDPLGDGRHRYDVDWNNPNSGAIVGAVNPLAAILTGGDEKQTSDFAGYFTNAASQGGDIAENARALYQKAGLDYATAMAAIDQLNIDPEKKQQYQNGINQLFGKDAYKKPQSFTGGSSPSGNASAANDLKGPGATSAISPPLLPSGQGPKPGATLPQINKKLGGSGMMPQYSQLGQPNNDLVLRKPPQQGQMPGLLPSGQGPMQGKPIKRQPAGRPLLPSGQGPTGSSPWATALAQAGSALGQGVGPNPMHEEMARQILQFQRPPDQFYGQRSNINNRTMNRFAGRAIG